jgi:hypothetical protein
MDFLFISLVTWSYKQTWQTSLRTQNNSTAHWWAQCKERNHEILGREKYDGDWCDAARYSWFTVGLLLPKLYTDLQHSRQRWRGKLWVPAQQAQGPEFKPQYGSGERGRQTQRIGLKRANHFFWYWKWNPGSCICQASAVPSKLQPQSWIFFFFFKATHVLLPATL